MPTENKLRISVRIPARHRKLKERLRRAAQVSGVIESEIVIAAVIAACEFVEKYRELTLPMKMSQNAIEEILERIEKQIREIKTRKKR